MTGSLDVAIEDEAISVSRTRRCIVTGDILPEGRLLRFVASPEGTVVPDVQAKLPGRGIWLRAERPVVETAVKKHMFARAAKAQVKVPADLADRAERLIVERMLSQLGLARRSGALILGFDQVERALRSEKPPAVIVEASDAAPDGVRKLQAATVARGVAPYVIEALSNAELSLAVGRGNVVHAALQPGHMAERLIFDAGRLEGFRPCRSWVWTGFEGGAVGKSWVVPIPPA